MYGGGGGREGTNGDSLLVRLSLKMFIDIAECSEDPNPCASQVRTRCKEIPGSFACECHDGFAYNATADECNGKSPLLFFLSKVVSFRNIFKISTNAMLMGKDHVLTRIISASTMMAVFNASA